MLARACAGTPRLLLLDRALDMLPDDDAKQLLTWLCRPEHPWSLVLITGREALADICHRRVELKRSTASPGVAEPNGQESDHA
jgi:predicted ABC-type transport system involved in lysophospholipase L1 biosynthesis ATPase subunit